MGGRQEGARPVWNGRRQARLTWRERARPAGGGLSAGGGQLASVIEQGANTPGEAGAAGRCCRGESGGLGGQQGGGGAPAASHLGPTVPSQGGGGERARWCRCNGDGVQRRRERGQGRRVRGAGRSGWALRARVHASMPGRGGTFSVARRGRADPTLPSLSRAAERGTCDASAAARGVWSGRSAAKRRGLGA